MARNVSTGSMNARPSPLQTVKSFTRYEPSTAPKASVSGRTRASTIQGVPPPSHNPPANAYSVSPEQISEERTEDVFDKRPSTDEAPSSPESERSVLRSQTQPGKFDELPIELASLTDRFVDSLGAKVYSEPPTIDQLSDLFQEFYIKASSHISTHISTLASRLNRESSPTPPKPAAKTKITTTRQGSKDSVDASEKNSHTQQMLTASEVTERRKARKMLEYKRIALEEAVERRACEKVYDKLWRHKSTLDEVRDEKLRSKTAALALVGIDLKDLGIDLDQGLSKTEEEIRELLAPAREGLAAMNDARYPLGKLKNLKNTHKSIVDMLSTIHTSSSSADEILPTLIYTLITSPAEGINVISNLHFIQRFRASNKIDGETAYCMTNLEAAINFLENVDLSSLRDDEAPEGPMKSPSRPATPNTERLEPISFPLQPSTSQPTTAITPSIVSVPTLNAPPTTSQSSTSSPLPSPIHQRRLSSLLNPSSKVLGAANDVRSTAEESFKNISSTLDNSFKLIFGRLREQSSDESQSEVMVPKTLDDARRLVNQNSIPEELGMMSESSSIADKDSESSRRNSKTDDKLLGMIGGRKQPPIRDRSADSVQSTGSGKRVAFASAGSSTNLSPPTQLSTSAQPNALDSVKHLGNSFNPLNSIGSAFGGGFRSFSKAVSSPQVTQAERETPKAPDSLVIAKVSNGDLKIDVPIQRFVDMQDSGELKMKDISELLSDYQRLAKAFKDLSSA